MENDTNLKRMRKVMGSILGKKHVKDVTDERLAELGDKILDNTINETNQVLGVQESDVEIEKSKTIDDMLDIEEEEEDLKELTDSNEYHRIKGKLGSLEDYEESRKIQEDEEAELRMYINGAPKEIRPNLWKNYATLGIFKQKHANVDKIYDMSKRLNAEFKTLDSKSAMLQFVLDVKNIVTFYEYASKLEEGKEKEGENNILDLLKEQMDAAICLYGDSRMKKVNKELNNMLVYQRIDEVCETEPYNYTEAKDYLTEDFKAE